MRNIDRVCRKYKVRNVIALEQKCRDSDQRRMRSLKWDYTKDSLDTRIVFDLVQVPQTELTPDENWRVNQMIWLWYHHAVSCAISRHKDRKKALEFVNKALEYQARIKDHPNKITPLFKLLLLGKLDEAKNFAKEPDFADRDLAKDLIEDWEMQAPC